MSTIKRKGSCPFCKAKNAEIEVILYGSTAHVLTECCKMDQPIAWNKKAKKYFSNRS